MTKISAHNFKKWIITICLLVASSGSLVSEPILVGEEAEYNISSGVEYFATSENLTLGEVAESGSFEKNRNDFFYKGFTRNHYWFKITLKNTKAESVKYLVLTSSLLDFVDFYYPDENGTYQKLVAGDRRPFSKWSEKWSRPSFALSLAQGREKTFYLRVATTSVFLFQFELQDVLTHAQARVYNNVIYGFMFALMLVYTVFIAMLSSKTGNRIYYYLIPVAILIYLFKFLLMGNPYPFLGDNTWLQDRLIVVVAALFMTLIVQYSRIYLRLKELQPWMDKMFVVLLLASFSGFYSFWNLTPELMKLLNIITFLITFLTLFASVRAWLGGQHYVRYFLIIWILLGAGNTLRVLTALGALPYAIWTIDQITFQYPVGLLLMVKSLYDKYNLIETSYIETEKKYNELLLSLQPGKKISRIAGLDVEGLIEKIQIIVRRENYLYQPDFDLQKMAELLKIRQDQLSQIFNQELGTPFKKFLNTVRVHKASELIKTFPDKTMTEIFLECGYANKTTFNNAFREILNTNPVAYKESLSQKKPDSNKKS